MVRATRVPSRQFTKRYLGKTSESGRTGVQISAMSRVRSFFVRSLLASTTLLSAACSHPHTAAPPAVSKASAPPPSRPAEAAHLTAAQIDAALRDEWTKGGLTPAPRADDAMFLRRVYVDIAGTLPPPEVTSQFLADTAPDKRAKLVDKLLASPDYAEHWMNYWDDVLMGRQTKANVVDRVSFRLWLRGRFARNEPWDRIVTELVAATGENGAGGAKVKQAAMAIPLGAMDDDMDGDPKDAKDGDDNAINGAVNWTLKYEQTPQDLGGSASRVFLGVQIQCAQCHDHKTEAWKQDDYRRFTSAFLRSRVEPRDRGKTQGQVRRVALEDFAGVPPRFQKKNPELEPIAKAKPTALDGTDLAKGKDTRKALAAWITSKQNPYFAKAFVNRMWGHFLGRGFVDPVDDIRPSNPATMPALFDRVAADFATDFDVKRLVRLLTATEAYQLTAAKPASRDADAENKLWSRFHLVPLGPEELLNGIFLVTDVEHTAKELGVKNMDQLRANVIRQYAFLFDTDEEDDEPDYSGTVSQALTLLNGALVAQGSRALPGSPAAQLVNGPGTDAEKVDALAMRVLARHATPAEKERWVAYVNEAGPAARGGKGDGGRNNVLRPLANRSQSISPKAAAYEDLLWSMLNSSEFTFNH